MKTNDYLLAAGTLAYSYLFYNQNAGINFLIFTILFALILLIRNRELQQRKRWLWALGLALISGAGVFITSSALAIIANCFSLLLLSAYAFTAKTSSVFSFLFSVYSMMSGVVWMLLDAINRSSKPKDEFSNGNKNGRKAIAVLIVVVLSLIFFMLYKQANPLFAENTKWINLDFISFGWLAFTLGGLFIIYPLFYHKKIETIERWENNLSLNNKMVEATANSNTERFAGVALFIFLNCMLVLLNLGDISSIWFNQSLPKGITHSDFVHNGVGMIILSILIATGLIMFMFRKNYTEIKNSKLLKFLIYVWILQNLVMLFSTVFRNQIYIHTYNLTYKRIGVYVWLSLAVIGLVIAFIKVFNNKSNWYLIKNNFAVWFTVLSLSSVISWDVMITRYNINNKPLHEVDFYYLFSLSDANIPELIAVTKDKNFTVINSNLKNFSNSYSRYYEQDYLRLLRTKIYVYVYNYKNNWQSYDVVDAGISKSLFK